MDRTKARAIISFYRDATKDQPETISVPGQLTPEQLALLQEQQLQQQQLARQVAQEIALREVTSQLTGREKTTGTLPQTRAGGTSAPTGTEEQQEQGWYEKAQEWWKGTWPWSPFQAWNFITDPFWIWGMSTLPAYAASRMWLPAIEAGTAGPAQKATWGVLQRVGNWSPAGIMERIGILKPETVPNVITRFSGQGTTNITQPSTGNLGTIVQTGTGNYPGSLTPTQSMQLQRAAYYGSEPTAAEIEALIAQQEGRATPEQLQLITGNTGRATAAELEALIAQQEGRATTTQPGFWSRIGQSITASGSNLRNYLLGGGAAGGLGAIYAPAASTAIGAAIPLVGTIAARVAGEYAAPAWNRELSRQGYSELIRPWFPMGPTQLGGPRTQEEFQLQAAGNEYWSGLEQAWNQLIHFQWPWEEGHQGANQ